MQHPIMRRTLSAAGALVASAALLSQMAIPSAVADFGYPPPDKTGRYVKRIAFPVVGKVRWSNTFGACRSGCSRRHEGQDLFGKKGQKLVAAVTGRIVVLRHGSTGNSLYLRSDADGWYYVYVHINNDTPGTDNGRNAYRQAFAPGIVQGSHVRRGQVIAYLGDSGNAEGTTPHCHFEMRKPASSVWRSQAVNAMYSLYAAKAGESSRSRAPAPKTGSVPAGVPPIRKGDSGARVVALQGALNVGTGTRLARDGKFGAATEIAVKSLQRWTRLTADGVYGPRSQWVLQVASSGAAR